MIFFSRHQYFQYFAHLSCGYFPYWETLFLYSQSGSPVDAALIQGNGKIQWLIYCEVSHRTVPYD